MADGSSKRDDRLTRTVLGWVGVCILASSFGWSGVQEVIKVSMTSEDRTGAAPELETDVMYLAPGFVRLDFAVNEAGVSEYSLIFDARAGSLLHLLHDVPEALVQSRKELREFAEKRRALQERLLERSGKGAASPPEVVEKRKELAEAQQAAAKSSTQLIKTDVTGELDGRRWTTYEQRHSGVRVRAAKVATWVDLGIPDEAVQSLVKADRFYAEMKEFLGPSPIESPFRHYLETGGLPLKTQQFNMDGAVILEAHMLSLESIPAPDGLFENPGYPEVGMADKLPDFE